MKPYAKKEAFGINGDGYDYLLLTEKEARMIFHYRQLDEASRQAFWDAIRDECLALKFRLRYEKQKHV